MRGRDVLLLAACGLGIVFSFSAHGSLELVLTWRHDIDTRTFSNRHYPLDSERLPTPIIADLDGDGTNEMIVATREPALIVLTADRTMTYEEAVDAADGDIGGGGGGRGRADKPRGKGRSTRPRRSTASGSTTGGPAPLPTLRKVSLLSGVRMTSGRQPVALAVGYIDHYRGANATAAGPREQVIVVVTQGWNVICFDAALNVLWEASVPEELPKFFYQREVAVLVSPNAMREGDRGSVVVGGRLDVEDMLETELGHNHEQPDKPTFEELDGIDADGNPLDPDVVRGEGAEGGEEGHGEGGEERHFNFYAFDGGSGALRWQHQSEDFHGLPDDEALFPHHNYKLDLRSHATHAGEVPWRLYRASVLDALPHRWTMRGDTRFELSHFKKDKVRRATNDKARRADGAANGRDRFSLEVTGLEESPVARYALDMMAEPHDESEHIAHPNVLVAHLERGVEIIHLYTGRTLTRIAMAGGTYADINADGVVEHMEAIITDEDSAPNSRMRGGGDLNGPECYAQVTAGIPPRYPLFNGSICADGGVADKFGTRGIYDDGAMGSDGELATIDPVIIRASTPFTHRSHVQEYKVVFFVNDGRLTCYSGKSRLMWQIDANVPWQMSLPELSTSHSAAMLDLMEESAAPLFAVGRLDLADPAEYVIAGGYTRVAVIDEFGEILTEADLPDVPIANVVLADVNSDGWNDLVVTTRSAFLIYISHPQAGSVLMPAVVGGLTLTMVFLYVSTRINAGAAGGGGGSRVRARRRPARTAPTDMRKVL